MPDTQKIEIEPIGVIRSCYPEKFGIPRQPGIATAAKATLELLGDYGHPDTVRGLEHCSHLWLLFLFSEHLDRGWTPLVRPPRSAGGKMGVFATRSTFRPNPIGLSVVKLDQVEIKNNQAILHLSGVDILDGTPIIDIKPYLPYADSISAAHNDYAPAFEPLDRPVHYSEAAHEVLAHRPDRDYLQTLIEQVLRCDPRPTHHRQGDSEHSYGIRLEDVNIRWRLSAEAILVDNIETIGT